jgi:hypothetical protein
MDTVKASEIVLTIRPAVITNRLLLMPTDTNLQLHAVSAIQDDLSQEVIPMAPLEVFPKIFKLEPNTTTVVG